MNRIIVMLALILLPVVAWSQEIPPDGARLSWAAPTEREDGTPLAPGELLEYRIFTGRSADDLTQLLAVDANTLEYLITGLDEGTWYFAVSVVDTNALSSGLSAVASKTIEAQPAPTFPTDPNRINIR